MAFLKIKKHVRQIPLLNSWFTQRMRDRITCFVVSYPKSGRTWLRVLIAKTLALHFGDRQEIVSEPNQVLKRCGKQELFFGFTHDGVTFEKSQGEKTHQTLHPFYQQKRVIYLLRDPRDVLVSYYFHRVHRMGEAYTMTDFLHHPIWGIHRILDFTERWLVYRNSLPACLTVQYEHMHEDIERELKRVVSFLSLNVEEQTIQQAVAYAHINNLRKLSTSHFQKETFTPSNPHDPNSHKFRKGKIGGYKEHFHANDLAFIRQELSRYPETFALYGASSN